MSYPVTSRVCLTCEYWQGERVVSKDGKRVLDKAGSKGVCTNFRSSYKHKLVSPYSGCADWYQWSATR